jgi:hypothetical protein
MENYDFIYPNVFVVLYMNIELSIAIGYEMDDQGFVPSRGKIFLFSTASRPALGPTSFLSNRYQK